MRQPAAHALHDFKDPIAGNAHLAADFSIGQLNQIVIRVFEAGYQFAIFQAMTSNLLENSEPKTPPIEILSLEEMLENCQLTKETENLLLVEFIKGRDESVVFQEYLKLVMVERKKQ